MAYNLIITARADELIDDSVCYLIDKLKNPDAAAHLLNGIDKIYDRLEENPFQFPESFDDYLKRRNYREALVTEMSYRIVFRVEDSDVYIVGLFHELENHKAKILGSPEE